MFACMFLAILASSVFADNVNVPLPRQGAFAGKGMSVGLAGGVFDPGGDCDCLGVWQAQGDFLYFSWLSAGLDVRFFGGDLDKDVVLMYQRYRMSAKAFLHGQSFAVYLSPVLGLENTSLSEFRKEWNEGVSRKDDYGAKADADSLEIVRSDCENMFSLDGFTIGAELGGGVTLGRYFGFTGSALYEYNFESAQQLTLTPGIAFDMRRVWGWASNKLLSMWVSVEVSFVRYFNRNVDSWARSGVFGVQLGI